MTDQLIANYDAFLASNKGYIVAYIDARGSGYRGWQYKQPIYGHFGTVEIQDQIATVKLVAHFFALMSTLTLSD